MKKEILQFLRSVDGYVSGEDISRKLKISRAAIWKYMQELRAEGYQIDALPHLGYELKSSPDKLLPCEVRYGLQTKTFGQTVHHYESLPTTMAEAFRLGMEGEAEGALVCAEMQTKGKGRLGRTWSSPKGKGIYASLILRPQMSPHHASQLTLMSAVAVCEAIREVSGVDAKIKWPNDLLYRDKKIAGILTELSAEMDRVRFLVVGIGINVNTPKASLPEIATSLKQITRKRIDRIKLLQDVLLRLEYWYERYTQDGFDPIVEKWKEYSSTIGRRVRISDQQGDVEGEAVDLDKSGGLVIKSEGGETFSRMSGDILLLP